VEPYCSVSGVFKPSMRFLCIFHLAMLLSGCFGYPSKTTTFQITTRNSHDSIQALVRGDTTIFIVISPSGIGGATIRVDDGNWSSKTIVSFRYPDGRSFVSLEHFIVRGHVQRDLSVPRDKFSPTATSMDIELPMEIFEGDQPAIELSWLDAYR